MTKTYTQVNNIIKKYKELDFDLLNKQIVFTNNQDIGEISKKTIFNIGKWALNGASNREIADNLEISEKQFKTLCSLCPTICYIMNDSRELAEIVLAGSLYQRAIGGQKIHKLVPQKVGDYQDGQKIGEHIEMVEVWDELPPDSNLLKFLAEHKLTEKFGIGTDEADKEVVEIVNHLDETKMKELEEKLKNDK